MSRQLCSSPILRIRVQIYLLDEASLVVVDWADHVCGCSVRRLEVGCLLAPCR